MSEGPELVSLALAVHSNNLNNRRQNGMGDLSDLGLVSIGMACKDLLGDLSDDKESNSMMIHSGIGALDLKFGGIPYPGITAICGGEERELKSLFIASLASNLSSRDHAVAILSRAPDFSAIAMRLLANRSGLALSTLRGRSIDDDDGEGWARFTNAFTGLLDESIYIRDIGNDSTSDVITWLADLKKSVGISVVVIEGSKNNIERFPERVNEYRELARRCSYGILFSLREDSCSEHMVKEYGCDMAITIENPEEFPIHPTSKYKNPVSAAVRHKFKHTERIMLEVDTYTGRVS